MDGDLAGQRLLHCKTCGASQPSWGENRRPPPGWLSVSVTVPDGVTTRNGKSFLWAGLYCCVACLAADIDRLAESEQLAGWRQA